MTVEDLLRVKRAERPSAESWLVFERELRAKQLAALVEKRPWWKSLPSRIGGLTRFHIPLGATAVLALTLISLRDVEPVVPEAGSAGAGMAALGSGVARIQDVAPSVVSAGVSERESTPVDAEPDLRSEATQPGDLARMVPLLAANEESSRSDELLSTTAMLAETRVITEAMLGTIQSGFEARALPVQVNRREPLAQISNPAETRRSRFAVAFATAAQLGSVHTEPSRASRRLSEQEIYESVHRFGASGNSVSLKF